MRNLIWGVTCVLACAAVAGSAVNGANELVYTVGAGETETVSAAWSTDYAGIVKEGEGTLVVAVANGAFAKPVKVNAGVLETTVDGAFGADVVTVASGAALSFKLTGCGQNTSYNTALKNVRIAAAARPTACCPSSRSRRTRRSAGASAGARRSSTSGGARSRSTVPART